eukprot:TRINITY_DN136510_c0_g1_i1.p1 TRINITY_DN136510_c0_g1~~TRINITY_DN136510_c0_g1_i1.p1  ORF type:complete len:144 (-),score=33.10 TRINITY_DN136510_c0_g1_i1:125-556(-)
MPAQNKKAKVAAKAHQKGVNSKRERKQRLNVHFFRPNTLKKSRKPKYPRRSAPSRTKLDAYRILKFPLTTESAMKKMEEDNTLVFITDIIANKNQIKNAIAQLYEVKVAKINTLIRPNGTKKAFVKLTADYDSLEVANSIGII